MTTNTDELPPLPDYVGSWTVSMAERMKEYARAAIAPYKTEIESLRTMLNTYNLGGWTDSHAILKRAEKAEARVAELEVCARKDRQSLRESQSEVKRLKAGGCARDQRLTQYCAEAAEFANRIRKLQELLAFIKDQGSTPLWIVDLIDAALEEQP
jgi:uncharacterized coiled-coil DUF342 family protein